MASAVDQFRAATKDPKVRWLARARRQSVAVGAATIQRSSLQKAATDNPEAPAGFPGERGRRGYRGRRGPTGPMGPRGIEGIKGEDGDPGRHGT